MSAQPPEDNLPDQIVAAYRRANGFDRSRPSQQVRDAIMEQAAHLATLRDKSAEQSLPPTSAANDSWWKWKAAASIAAVGLAGLLAMQTFRTAPHGTGRASEGSNIGNAPSITGARSTATPAPSDDGSAAPPATAASQAPDGARSNPGIKLRPQKHLTITPPVDAAAIRNDAERQESSEAPATSALSAAYNRVARASAAAAHPWRDQVIAQARAGFPELFNGAPMSGAAHIAMALNSDGTVHKIARVEPPVSSDSNASVQLSKALGLDDDDLENPATFIVLDKTSDQHNTIVVAFGVLRNMGSASGTH